MPGEYWQLHTENFAIDGKVSRFSINGVVRGATSRTEVLTLVLAAHPLVLDNCVRKGVSKADRLGGGVWMTTLDYSSMDPLQALAPGAGGTGGVTGSPSAPASGTDGLDDSYSFDFNAQTTHITQSIQTQYAFGPGEVAGGGSGLTVTITAPAGRVVNPGPGGYAPVAGDLNKRIRVKSAVGFTGGVFTITAVNVGGSEWTLDRSVGSSGAVSGAWTFIGGAPDFKNAIGVSDDRVEGVDIFTPSFTWQRTSPIETVSRDYMRTLRNLIGTTNAAAFYGSALGECLFVGCSGQGGQGKRWNVTFKFAENENRTNVDVGGGIILPAVGGWDHVWIRYKRQAIATAMLQVPAFAYVEQIYYPGDFTALNIGA